VNKYVKDFKTKVKKAKKEAQKEFNSMSEIDSIELTKASIRFQKKAQSSV
jgi:hypothetical protein